jgi:hypothetical protein
MDKSMLAWMLPGDRSRECSQCCSAAHLTRMSLKTSAVGRKAWHAWHLVLAALAGLWGMSGFSMADERQSIGVGYGSSSAALSVHLQRKAESGSQTVAVKSREMLSYNSAAPIARKSGSGQGRGIDDKVGFRCANGKQWAIIKGEIQCGETLSLSGGAATLLSGGKSLYVQANLGGGFRTGRFLRITGTNMDVRIDMFALDGSVTGSCFLTQDVNACHLGSPNSANPGLAAVPQFPTTGGVMRYASELVEGNLVFAGTRTGGALQDAYIASVVKTDSTFTVYFVGLHHLDGSQGNQLRPIYSWSRFNWDALSGMLGSAAQATLVTSTVWSANTP